MDKISIIIPIYNVEKYLKKCLDSVLNQTYKNLEIILINDGSTDSSSTILKEYQEKDKRIKVIYQKNQGLSVARNQGILNSTGKYISFIDSDDFIEYDFIEYLYKLLNKYRADIVSCSINKKNQKEKLKILSQEEALKEMINFKKNMQTCVMNKLYKKEVLKNIKFQEGVVYEDIYFNGKALLNANRVVVSNLSKYHYIYRENSISNQKFSKREFDRVENSFLLYKLIISSYPNLNYFFKFYYYANCLGCINKMIHANKYDYKFISKIQREIRKDLLNFLNLKYEGRRVIQMLIFAIYFPLYKNLYRLK